MHRDRTKYQVAFLLLLALTLVACGGSGSTGATATPTPRSLTDQAGTGPKGLPLYCPWAVTVDSQGALYVSDNDIGAVHERVVKLSPQGQVLSEWHPFPPDRLGTTQGPGKIAVDGQGNMYISDLGRSKVLKISPTGTLLTSWGTYGDGPGQFMLIAGVAVDGQGNVYVSDQDSSNGRIEKFTNTGTLLGTFIPKIKGDKQTAFYPSGLTFDSNNILYAVDGINLVKLSTTGQLLDSSSVIDSNPAAIREWRGISINARGELYVIHLTTSGTDHYPRIVKLDWATGTSLAVFNVWKTGINVVTSIAVDNQGNVYATDAGKTGGLQLQKYSPKGTLLSTWKGTCHE